MTLPSLKPSVRQPSLVESVYETLLEAITSRQLPPGTNLNSVALAQQLEVSRTPVKEALKLLAHDGLVQQVNNHKARVATFTQQDVIEIYEIRMQLEGLAALKAAKALTAEELRSLYEQGQQLSNSFGAVDWSAQAIEYDLQFHRIIAAGSGNERLHTEILHYRAIVRGFCQLTGDEITLRQALEEHLEIARALVARRPVRARRGMEEHIAARQAAVLRVLFANQPAK